MGTFGLRLIKMCDNQVLYYGNNTSWNFQKITRAYILNGVLEKTLLCENTNLLVKLKYNRVTLFDSRLTLLDWWSYFSCNYFQIDFLGHWYVVRILPHILIRVGSMMELNTSICLLKVPVCF